MNRFRITAALVVAAAIAAPAVFADPVSAPPPGGHGPRGSMGRPGLPQLAGIDLTEAQEDRVFAILHAQAPQLREQDKIEDKAHAALRAMSEAGDFSEAKAAVHTKALGQAIAARELLRVRTAGQVMALLTPEQRAQLKGARAPRAPR
jgi:Spy/CpxP family protein refolding chaperone